MRFCSWYPAEDIAALAPEGPGVFQVRVADLLRYPKGRSAMIHYGQSQQLRETMLAWAAEQGPADARYRHTEELGSRTPAEELARLEARFIDRFGEPPRSKT